VVGFSARNSRSHDCGLARFYKCAKQGVLPFSFYDNALHLYELRLYQIQPLHISALPFAAVLAGVYLDRLIDRLDTNGARLELFFSLLLFGIFAKDIVTDKKTILHLSFIITTARSTRTSNRGSSSLSPFGRAPLRCFPCGCPRTTEAVNLYSPRSRRFRRCGYRRNYNLFCSFQHAEERLGRL
jgi:hypothetical protein